MAERKLSKEELKSNDRGWCLVIGGIILLIICVLITMIACPGWRPF